MLDLAKNYIPSGYGGLLLFYGQPRVMHKCSVNELVTNCLDLTHKNLDLVTKIVGVIIKFRNDLVYAQHIRWTVKIEAQQCIFKIYLSNSSFSGYSHSSTFPYPFRQFICSCFNTVPVDH